MKNRIAFVVVLIAMLALLLLGCSLGGRGAARITPTPTKTTRPLNTVTLTPTPSPQPSATPTPTDTPVPPTDTPTPTDTPLPTNTPLPTDTPILPTDTPAPTNTTVPPTATVPPPTNTPRPAATQPPAKPTDTPKPSVDFRVQEILAFEDGSLTQTGLHNVYFTVVDANGTPLDGITIEETGNQPTVQVISGDKGPGKAEFTMWASVYRFKVVGDSGGQTFTSDETHQVTILFGQANWDDLVRGGICPDVAACQAMGPMHYSYNITFQRTW